MSTLFISFGKNQYFELNGDNLIVHNRPSLERSAEEIDLGLFTEAKLNMMIECLERLRCYAVPAQN